MMGMMRIDLHTHSTASDGTDSPADLVARAAAEGLDVVAITDHDTTAGWEQARAARPSGLTVVPGTEFSCVYLAPDGRRVTLHLLGYLFDPDDVELHAERARLREARLRRGRQMVENMSADGIPISWPQVEALAGGGPVGRPHIGRALVAAGVVPDVHSAFGDLLSARRPYYVRKVDTDVFLALRLLLRAGAVPVFAHPLARRRGPVVDDEVIARLAAAGLVGLEVDHPDHDAADRAHAAALAQGLGLVPTGASDYHGSNKATRLGACTTAPESLAALLDRPAAARPWGPA